MTQLATLMDSAQQPRLLLHAWKANQFSQLIYLCDLTKHAQIEDGRRVNPNWQGTKLHMSNNIRE